MASSEEAEEKKELTARAEENEIMHIFVRTRRYCSLILERRAILSCV